MALLLFVEREGSALDGKGGSTARDRRRSRRRPFPRTPAIAMAALVLAAAEAAASRWVRSAPSRRGGLSFVSTATRALGPAISFDGGRQDARPPSSRPPSSRPPSRRIAAPTSLRAYTNRPNNDAPSKKDLLDPSETLSGYRRPKVNWYPGHIAKAERQLSETLKSVDVVVEVRDARAPKATAHPSVGKWAAGRPRVVVLTRMDAVTGRSRDSWAGAFNTFGAERWEEALGGDERNRNAQWRREKSKYGVDITHNPGGGQVEDVLFVDAKRGKGTHAISRAITRAGQHVNERRKKRGLNDRPLRVGIIGFPNVGKSALINRLLGRKRAKTANTPGVTRSLQWIRVAADKNTGSSGTGSKGRKSGRGGFELLDSPGIIPADMIDQGDALLLAACNSVGVGAYDNQAVAAYLLDRIQGLLLMGKGSMAAPAWKDKCMERYGFDPLAPLSEQKIASRLITGSSSVVGRVAAASGDRIPTGEDMLFIVADKTCQGDPETAARKILQDFRSLRMGPIALQLAPESDRDNGQLAVRDTRGDGLGAFADGVYRSPADRERAEEEQRTKERKEVERRARAAMEAAKERGLDLPPVVEEMVGSGNDDVKGGGESESGADSKPSESDVGKGLFDGW